jgi:hypothetical protein
MEAHPIVPDGAGDRFAGYGVLGVAFPSGDVLAFRRYPASSVGPAYGSVWHHDRTGTWTFYQDVEPGLGCTRYFGGRVDRTLIVPIRVVWTGRSAFSVLVDDGRGLEWAVELGATLATRVISLVAARLSRNAWKAAMVSRLATGAAAAALGSGPLRMAGRTPDGHAYLTHPLGLWAVTRSRAVIGRRYAGAGISLAADLRLGDFRIPRIGLFAVGRAYMSVRN